MKFFSLIAIALLTTAHVHAQDNASRLLEEERLEQSGTVISIIFDDSGSMQGEKLSQAKQAFRDWLSTVPDDYRIGLTALNAGSLVQWQRGNKSAVADAVAEIRATGDTPLADTIIKTRKNILKRQKERPFERHVLLIFTDGEDSSPNGADRVQQSLTDAARRNIETVGIGFHGHGDYMASTATRYFDAGNTEELMQGLAKVDSEIGDTSDIVISPEIAAEMNNISTTNLMPSPNSRPAESPARTSAPSQTPKVRKDSFPVFVFVSAVIILIALYQFLRKFL